MKIYAAKRYELWRQIDQFIGKDAWVKCYRFNDSQSCMGEVYIRIYGMADVYGNTRDFYSTTAWLDAWIVEQEHPPRNPEDARATIERILTPRPTRKDNIELKLRPCIEVYDTSDIMLKVAGTVYEDLL